MKKLALFLFFCAVGSFLRAQTSDLYEVREGTLEFSSNAPKELIHARSVALRGLLDAEKQTFAFRIFINTFEGFNSPLQREHFNENYMESRLYPEATFSGKILDAVDLRRDGTYPVRAKGTLKVHGLAVERIVPGRIVVRGGQVSIESDFIVSLPDHRIKIPRVVFHKLSPDIQVTVRAAAVPKP